MSDEACDVSEVNYGARMTASTSFVQLNLVENVADEWCCTARFFSHKMSQSQTKLRVVGSPRYERYGEHPCSRDMHAESEQSDGDH